jgi:hypothetical protein
MAFEIITCEFALVVSILTEALHFSKLLCAARLGNGEPVKLRCDRACLKGDAFSRAGHSGYK